MILFTTLCRVRKQPSFSHPFPTNVIAPAAIVNLVGVNYNFPNELSTIPRLTFVFPRINAVILSIVRY